MKQAQSEATEYRAHYQWLPQDSAMTSCSQRPDKGGSRSVRVIERSRPPLWGELMMTSIRALWFVVSLPFRLVFWTIAWLGRATAVVLGFTLMVVGMALWAGPLFFVGIPLFLVGLVL